MKYKVTFFSRHYAIFTEGPVSRIVWFVQLDTEVDQVPAVSGAVETGGRVSSLTAADDGCSQHCGPSSAWWSGLRRRSRTPPRCEYQRKRKYLFIFFFT